MELKGLQQSIDYLEEHDFEVGTLITDRHRQIAKWIRERLSDAEHLYDGWHVAKGMLSTCIIKHYTTCINIDMQGQHFQSNEEIAFVSTIKMLLVYMSEYGGILLYMYYIKKHLRV